MIQRCFIIFENLILNNFFKDWFLAIIDHFFRKYMKGLTTSASIFNVYKG
ncbi:Hypothetical cytosolic protein [Lacticaseibacillus paracasei]|uniref:Cytosolic protein n=1 Tax=Lacticaseibacillus paracasei subsp. paracasei TaxID=47714 RepID=A0AAP9HFQ6_LACPA|nr:Hypothetical cytosolic protein [Lacticaseibacillus paracasei]QGV16954.1 putative cytosolic protein [Lacticaseibacillus paracasei subsp. paracasei]